MKNIKNLLLSLAVVAATSILIFVSGTIHAQVRTAADTVAPSTFPAILIKDKDRNQSVPLRMNELKIDVKVIGNIATTTMEMNFYNSLERVLEGELYFPLGEGQTVSRFAMDVSGKLREGVVVEKAKGRQVFESVVRQNIDPGLLEWTKGNNFRARIYPIPAKGNKRIIIAYEQELVQLDKGSLYLLPLNFKDKVDRFSVHLEVLKQKVKPILEKNELVNFEFEEWQDSYIAQKEYSNYLPGAQIAFTIPETDIQKIFTEKNDAGNYFYVNLLTGNNTQEKTLPRKICLLWDVSGSAANKNVEKELALLDAYFKKIGDVQIQLVSFCNTVAAPVDFSIIAGNCDKLKEKIRSLAYDGGTQFANIALEKYNCDEFILSSDGLSNLSDAEIKLSKTPVMVINSSISADHSYLKYVSSTTGGQYLNLTKITKEEALKMLTQAAEQFITADYDKNTVKEIYPSQPTVVGKNFSIAGKMLKENAEITLHFGFGGKILYSVKVSIHKDSAFTSTGLVKRIWAQKKLEELDMQYSKYENEITELGKQYGIVTRNTSLIVLDRIEDYVQHKIVPPAEMQQEYYAMLDKDTKEKNKISKEHLEEVITAFNKRVEWWNKEFKPIYIDIKKDKRNDAITDSIRVTQEVFQLIMEDRANTRELSEVQSIARANSSIVSEEKMMKEKSVHESNAPTIELKTWDPKSPYISEIRNTKKDERFERYMLLKKSYASTPSFFMDVSEFFLNEGDTLTGIRILTNIAELELENHQLLRVLARKLEQLQHFSEAIAIYKVVLKIREEEPQSYRDLGLAYSNDKQYQQAIDMLYELINKKWDGRFPEVEVIAVCEMNSIIAKSKSPLVLEKIDKRLLKNLPLNIRIVLNWDADNCDMDLWITDPRGEKCFYSNRETRIGGFMSRDFTGGYGPEEFLLKKAANGKYQVQVNYYGSRQQRIAGPTTIQMELFTNYGKANEKKREVTLRLTENKEVLDVADLIF